LKNTEKIMLLKVNPTRIELIRLKRKLKVVTQGYKLLKKKRDGLMREFLKVVKELKVQREKIKKELSLNFKNFIFTRASLRNKEIEEIFAVPTKEIWIETKSQIIMGVKVPILELKEKGDFLNYGLFSSSVNLDLGLKGMEKIIKDLVNLAQLQKTAFNLAFELEKTRRRVNALEYIHLPKLKSTIKYISNKLEERERFENIVLMKTKELVS